MAFYNSFKFAPAEWIPFKDREVLDSVVNVDMYEKQGKTDKAVELYNRIKNEYPQAPEAVNIDRFINVK